MAFTVVYDANALYPNSLRDLLVRIAQAAGAQVIVTRTLKDFPGSDLQPWSVDAKSPDDFVLDQVGIDGRIVTACVRQIADSRTQPPVAVEDVLSQLERDGLVQAVAALRSA